MGICAVLGTEFSLPAHPRLWAAIGAIFLAPRNGLRRFLLNKAWRTNCWGLVGGFCWHTGEDERLYSKCIMRTEPPPSSMWLQKSRKKPPAGDVSGSEVPQGVFSSCTGTDWHIQKCGRWTFLWVQTSTWGDPGNPSRQRRWGQLTDTISPLAQSHRYGTPWNEISSSELLTEEARQNFFKS